MDIPSLFFEDHPSPMLIFDTDTLEIVEVNKSAEQKYGFTRDEFTQLTIEDIRPPEDITLLRDRLKELKDESKIFDYGTFRHRTKEGEILYVQITTQKFPIEDRSARIVHIHDISETIRLKKEIEESYRDQRQHIENNPLGMVKYDRNFRILEWSKRAEKKTGYTKDEILGASIMDMDLFVEGKNEEIRDRLKELSSGKKKKDRFETAIRLKDGSNMDVLIHASALRSKRGTLKSVLAFIENISDRKEYERELIKREKKYHQLFEDANDGIFLMDGLTVIDCNQRVAEMVGYDKDKIIGNTPLLFSPEYQPDGTLSREKAEEKVTQTIEGSPQRFEWKHEKKNGNFITTEVSLNAISLDGNIYIQAIIRDITEQQKVQQELIRREKLFESLFWDSPVAIVMIDTEGQVQKLNKSFEDLFGYSEKQLKGKDLLKHQLPEERYDEVDDIYEHVFSDDGMSKYYEDQRITRGGEVKDLLVGALPVSIDGEPIGAFGIYTDITKLRAAEQNLKESLKEKEVLLSEIHHRVKNNLAIISGLLLLEAMNWEEDSTVHKVLMHSKLRIHSMAKIHEKLYESQDFANLNLENYVRELVNTISMSMNGAENGVDINIDCDDIYLNINQALPCALIINELVTNSFKYAFDGEQDNELDVKFRRDGEMVNIVVADNGLGLPKDFKKMAKNSLGHQLVMQLVKQLDGKIDVETGKNKGTRHKIMFKRAKKSGSASNYFV